MDRRELLKGLAASALVVGFDPAARGWVRAAEMSSGCGPFPIAKVPPLEGVLYRDWATRNADSTDMGKIVRKMPAAVLRPGSVEDIRKMVRFCRQHGIKVAARGQHHTVHGQGLTCGLIIETAPLSTITRSAYRVLRGQVYEGVSQISMGWMLSTLGSALETYGLVAGAALHRQAENTQIQGIYNAEQTAAKKALEAANQSTEARLISSVAGVEGGLVTNLGQIQANQVTQTLMAEANKTFGLLSSSAATRREITGTLAEAEGTREARTFDGKKEVELRGQGNLERFGMKTYEFTPGGSSIAGTSVPVRTGQELFDWARDKHPIQEVNKRMDSTTRDTVALQNNNTQIVADQKIEASNTYQSDINKALEGQASQNIAAINQGSGIASQSSRRGAGIQLSGIRRSADIERGSNQLNF